MTLERFNQKVSRAKKEHICDNCGAVIKAGDDYLTFEVYYYEGISARKTKEKKRHCKTCMEKESPVEEPATVPQPLPPEERAAIQAQVDSVMAPTGQEDIFLENPAGGDKPPAEPSTPKPAPVSKPDPSPIYPKRQGEVKPMPNKEAGPTGTEGYKPPEPTYYVVCEDTLPNLTAKVNTMMQKGWRPLGGITVSAVAPPKLMQAMERVLVVDTP